jgi:acyl phosphate:glycerol-3-phosphate acyltransferase
MTHFLLITVIVVGYLLGSIPFGFLLVKFLRGEDIRLTGSGNIGATNVARSGAKGLGIATLVLDALKGSLAVAFAWWLAYSRGAHPLRYMAVASLAAVLGHVFPVWLKFKGGKGVATALGVFILLFPHALLVSLAIFILVVVTTRLVSLGSILAAIAFPIAAHFINHPDRMTLEPVLLVCLIVVVKHHANIRRLLAGTENRFGSKEPPVAGEES